MNIDLFSLAWTLGISSLILSMIELLATHTFSTFFFKFGIPIYKKTLELDEIVFPLNHYETIINEEGKFRFINNKVYFLSQIFFFRFFRITTPFPFKAVGEIKSKKLLEIKARIPIGTSLFFTLWIIGWTAGSIGAANYSNDMRIMGFGLIGWIVAGLILLISYQIEKSRMNTMVEELKEIVCKSKTKQ